MEVVNSIYFTLPNEKFFHNVLLGEEVVADYKINSIYFTLLNDITDCKCNTAVKIGLSNEFLDETKERIL